MFPRSKQADQFAYLALGRVDETTNQVTWLGEKHDPATTTLDALARALPAGVYICAAHNAAGVSLVTSPKFGLEPTPPPAADPSLEAETRRYLAEPATALASSGIHSVRGLEPVKQVEWIAIQNLFKQTQEQQREVRETIIANCRETNALAMDAIKAVTALAAAPRGAGGEESSASTEALRDARAENRRLADAQFSRENEWRTQRASYESELGELRREVASLTKQNLKLEREAADSDREVSRAKTKVGTRDLLDFLGPHVPRLMELLKIYAPGEAGKRWQSELAKEMASQALESPEGKETARNYVERYTARQVALAEEHQRQQAALLEEHQRQQAALAQQYAAQQAAQPEPQAAQQSPINATTSV
jgi:hypothetical protein